MHKSIIASIIAALALILGLSTAATAAAPTAIVAEVEPGETDGSGNLADPPEGTEWDNYTDPGGAQGLDADIVVGKISNSSTSSSTVRSYDNRYTTTRFKAGNCSGNIRTVYPGQTTPFWYDADCLRLQSGSYKVTAIVKVFDKWGRKIAEKNIGCTTNRFDVAVQAVETARAYYARKCY